MCIFMDIEKIKLNISVSLKDTREIKFVLDVGSLRMPLSLKNVCLVYFTKPKMVLRWE